MSNLLSLGLLYNIILLNITTPALHTPLAISPSGHHIAFVNTEHSISILNTNSKSILSFNLSITVNSLFYSADESCIYAVNKTGIGRYSLSQNVDNQSKAVVADSQFNDITDASLSPNYESVVFVNSSNIYILDIFSNKLSKIHLNQTLYELCNPFICNLDGKTNMLVTSSQTCNLCSFVNANNTWLFKNNQAVDECLANQLGFIDKKLILTQKTKIGNQSVIKTFDLITLKPIQSFNQPSQNLQTNFLQLKNYIISYTLSDKYIWIYQNGFNSTANQYDLTPWTIRNSVVNSQNNQIYLLVQHQQTLQWTIHGYQLQFNCSNVKGGNPQILGFHNHCQCLKQNYVFQRSTLSCKSAFCGIPNKTECICPKQASYDAFDLSCHANCSKIYNSVNAPAFGSPQQCYCSPPFAWNSILSDCSLIDCSKILKSVSKNIGTLCLCQNETKWNDKKIDCEIEQIHNQVLIAEESSSNVGLIIGIIFAFLLLILSGVIYYFRKCKKDPLQDNTNKNDIQLQHKHPNIQTVGSARILSSTKSKKVGDYEKHIKQLDLKQNMDSFSIGQQQMDKH